MNEEWRSVIGWEDRYEISTHGRVKSLCHRGLPRKTPAIMAPGNNGKGYRSVALCRDGKVSRRLLHRLVLETFVGPSPEGAEGCHMDGNPANNRLDNLMWGSKIVNAKHRDAHGTTSWGEGRPLAVFTEQEVRELRAMYAAGMKRSAVVKMTVEKKGCDPTVVRDILAHRTWKRVEI